MDLKFLVFGLKDCEDFPYLDLLYFRLFVEDYTVISLI